MTDYKDYLLSPEWKAKRKEILKRDGFKCTMCGSGKNLNVHHISYESIGNESEEDLTTLCSNCHGKVHSEDLKACDNKHKKDWYIEKTPLDFAREINNGNYIEISKVNRSVISACDYILMYDITYYTRSYWGDSKCYISWFDHLVNQTLEMETLERTVNHKFYNIIDYLKNEFKEDPQSIEAIDYLLSRFEHRHLDFETYQKCRDIVFDHMKFINQNSDS